LARKRNFDSVYGFYLGDAAFKRARDAEGWTPADIQAIDRHETPDYITRALRDLGAEGRGDGRRSQEQRIQSGRYQYRNLDQAGPGDIDPEYAEVDDISEVSRRIALERITSHAGGKGKQKRQRKREAQRR